MTAKTIKKNKPNATRKMCELNRWNKLLNVTLLYALLALITNANPSTQSDTLTKIII